MEDDGLNIGLDEEEGDGHRSLEDMIETKAVGAHIDLSKWKRGESSIATMGKSYQGVLQKIATAVTPKEETQEYRQILLLGNYLSAEEADRVTAAIDESFRYGLSLRPILDWVINRCAVRGGRVNDIKDIMTHQIITMQRYKSGNKKDERIDKRVLP